jgi:predicted nucleic acid-binding protein
MARRKLVAATNTSPIIALTRVGQLPLLERLFERILAPFDVYAELDAKVGAPEPAALRALANLDLVPRIPGVAEIPGLHLGESQAIAVAVARRADRVLLDERRARQAAAALGVRPVGTVGILLEARRRGLIPAVRPLLDRLVAAGFHLHPALIERVLADAGEKDEPPPKKQRPFRKPKYTRTDD